MSEEACADQNTPAARAAAIPGGSVRTVIDAASLASALGRDGVRDVAADDTTRALYTSDASLYRLLPLVVVRPHDDAEVETVLTVCRREGVPFTSRGGGTSIAGNAIGTGVVLDFSRHMNRVFDLDAETRTAVVQPGVIQADLQRRAAAVGLRFGPDPSSINR